VGGAVSRAWCGLRSRASPVAVTMAETMGRSAARLRERSRRLVAETVAGIVLPDLVRSCRELRCRWLLLTGCGSCLLAI
jgi:hypothetical protein